MIYLFKKINSKKMNSFSDIMSAIENELEAVIVIDNKNIPDLNIFATNLSKEFEFNLHYFSKNLFIFKNNFKFILIYLINENNQMSFIISFMPIHIDDDYKTDDCISDDDYETDKEI